jgi:hypothetical protein
LIVYLGTLNFMSRIARTDNSRIHGMSPLPIWMRAALFATAAMNVIGAMAFVPAAQPLRDLGGLPDTDHPLYVATVGVFVFVLGLGYLACAVLNRADRIFIAVGATGKLAFFALLVGLWISGDLPILAPVAGGGDLLFGLIFVAWLVQARVPE